MKYKIIVERDLKGGYSAYSPVAENLNARGESVAIVLDKLRNQMLCYLHDPEVELDIVIECTTGDVLDFSSNMLRTQK